MLKFFSDYFGPSETGPSFALFDKMPIDLIESALSFLNLSDLLKASRSCKVMKESACQILRKVTDLCSLAFFPPSQWRGMNGNALCNLLMRLPALQKVDPPLAMTRAGFPSFRDFICSKCTLAQREALHQQLAHLQNQLISRDELESLTCPLNFILSPELRSFSFEPVVCRGHRMAEFLLP